MVGSDGREDLARYGTVGLEFILTFLAGVGLGWLADDWLGWSPWFTLAGACIGFASGLARLILLAREYHRRSRSDEDPGNRDREA
jgi:F0F1-type ATP synthase assembly protein I